MEWVKKNIKDKWPKKDITGLQFRNWKVLSLSHRGEDNKGKGLWYWNVQCVNCEIILQRTTNYVKSSLGCICCGLTPKGDAGLNKVIGSYRDSAKKRNIIFDLDKEQFRQITSCPCYYCGCPPEIKKLRKYKYGRSSWGDYIYNGIDRMDNTQGYTVENCVACCRTCNRGKGAWSFDFWLSYLRKFADNVISGRVPCLKENKIVFEKDFNELTSKIF